MKVVSLYYDCLQTLFIEWLLYPQVRLRSLIHPTASHSARLHTRMEVLGVKGRGGCAKGKRNVEKQEGAEARWAGMP